MTLDDLLERLDGVTGNGRDYKALCPAHEDRSPSLSVTEKDGKVLWHCHAGCSQNDVMNALGIQPGDIPARPSEEPEQVYQYVDEDWQLLYEVLRYPGKKFRQRQHLPDHPEADLGGWVWSLGRDETPDRPAVPYVRRVLYNLPHVVNAVQNGVTVYLTEGEKCADALTAIGKVATCNSGGAGKWDDDYTDALTGATVIQVVDRDEAGRKHAELVKTALAGKAAAHHLLQAKRGKDTYDHLVTHGLPVEELKAFRPRVRMTWQSVNLADPGFGGKNGPPDICGLIYTGARHAISGPPEATKTLCALIFGLEHMRKHGGTLALVDFEMGAVATRRLLLDLGATMEEVGSIYYVTPDGPPEESDLDDIDAAGVTFAVIDSVAGAYGSSGLDDNNRSDAETFSRTWIAPLWHLGVTTVVLDHVVKAADGRGRYMIGSERKLGTVDVHLGFEPVHALSRGGFGMINISTHKDRLGFLPRPQAASLELRSDPVSHRVSWDFQSAADRVPFAGLGA